MRYAKGIRLKTTQWGEMADLPIDSVAIHRDILVRQNESASAEIEAKEYNRMLLADLDDRWESSREEDADQA